MQRLGRSPLRGSRSSTHVVDLMVQHSIGIRPLGLPSAVQVFALSLERSPIQITVTSAEAGNVFVQPQSPSFRANLRNITAEARSVQIEASVTDFDGRVGKFRVNASLAAKSQTVLDVPLPQNQRGRLNARKPIELSGTPTHLGLWVRGNSSWVRMTFELADAEGETWSGKPLLRPSGFRRPRPES